MSAGETGPDPLEVLARRSLPEQVRTAEHGLRLLPEMDAVLGTIQRDVERATRRVLVETYIYRDDRLGRGFADSLARAAARGVDVRLIYDPLGSNHTPTSFFEALCARGVNARAYRPPSTFLGGGSVFPRDHSRVIVVDDHAYTGGAAWGDEWLPKRLGGEGWHDVCMQVEGPSVDDFARLFEMRWREATGEIEVPKDLDRGQAYPELELLADAPSRVDLVYERHLEAIHAARERVWMCNAYFYPPSAMRDALFDAAARGVDVQVVSTGETDLPIVKRAARADHAYWIRRGLRIFEYQKGLLHAKYALFDRDLCTVGTLNANPTSMKLANEVNVFVSEPAFVQRVAELFASDRSDSREVSLDEALRRPILERIADNLACDALHLVDALFGPRARGKG